VFCQLEVLRYCFPPSVRRILDELPEGLDETYERILRSIKKPNQTYAHRMLQCLVAAVRPLRVEELAEVLAFDFDAEGIPEMHLAWRWENEEEAVMSACSNLVIIVRHRRGQRIVQFSHFTVKEFLTANRLAEPIRDVSRYHIRLDAAHTILVRACLGVLLRLKTGIIGGFPLVSYAAVFWSIHARFEDVSSRVKDGIRCLFDADKPHFNAWIIMHRPWFDEEKDHPLYHVACFGFRDEAEHIIAEHPEQINAKDTCGLTPLHATAAAGHTDILSLLLKHGADVEARDAMDYTPLHRAAMGGRLEAGQCLLDHGADINPRGLFNWTPLCLAVISHEEHVEFARMLLERGAAMDVRPQLDYGYTPLTAAIKMGRVQIVRLLLEYGEDVNERDGLVGKSPSQWASKCKQQEILEILTEYGAESV
jgi:ankyrin repeat protein